MLTNWELHAVLTLVNEELEILPDRIGDEEDEDAVDEMEHTQLALISARRKMLNMFTITKGSDNNG